MTILQKVPLVPTKPGRRWHGCWPSPPAEQPAEHHRATTQIARLAAGLRAGLAVGRRRQLGHAALARHQFRTPGSWSANCATGPSSARLRAYGAAANTMRSNNCSTGSAKTHEFPPLEPSIKDSGHPLQQVIVETAMRGEHLPRHPPDRHR